MTYVDRVHFDDVDFARTPFYGRYFTWVDRAWEVALHEHGIWFGEMVGEHLVGLPIVEAVARYRRALALDDEFAVEIRVAELSRRGVTTEFRFRRLRDGELTSEGHVRRRFVDMRVFRGTELSDDLYARFEALAAQHADWPPEDGDSSWSASS
jgi:YbgC/YbaW family acyl-CoA thioester hydrolase